MNDKKYTIDDLCSIIGYPRRTIRYYVQEGLIEPPAGRGRGGFYYDSHVEKLRQIKALQEKGLKLAAIREILQGKRQRPEELPTPPEREVWIQCVVAPGIEIHIRRDVEETQRESVAEILRVARTLLEKERRREDEKG